MNVKRIEKGQNEKFRFPRLMKSKFNGVIIYAVNQVNDLIEGVVLYGSTSNHIEEGEYSSNWDANVFEDYNYKIVLEND